LEPSTSKATEKIDERMRMKRAAIKTDFFLNLDGKIEGVLSADEDDEDGDEDEEDDDESLLPSVTLESLLLLDDEFVASWLISSMNSQKKVKRFDTNVDRPKNQKNE